MQVQMFSQAAHCYEELLLHQAHHIPYYVQYADILYTIGGSSGQNFRTARSYYSAAVQLSKGTNIRALYGLCACSAQLGGIRVRAALQCNHDTRTCCAAQLALPVAGTVAEVVNRSLLT